MKRYNPKEIEPKWQKKWSADKTFEVETDPSKPKKYIIDMFPYPSGAAMHVGHVRNFTISDVLSQYHRQKGYNVMHTMGWDTFGLPAENYAIKTGTPPAETTKANIANFKHQLTQLGMSYDWSREINTTDPEYYKWTQWIFTKLFENDLAYQKESAQWWCPVDKTVLANEQVENGKCWRCGNEVIKKNLKQWFFKITDYADQLLDGIDDLDWPEKIKTMQRNWIGRSKGAQVKFQVSGNKGQVIEVFTTRPDTLFGATFMVLAPEHELVAKITTTEQKAEVEKYVKAAQKKSEIERQENKQKSGVLTGAYAINPVSSEEIPIWIADYVLMGYGTGAIMAVPAHDERDNEFAQKFNLPINQVVASYEVYQGDVAPRDDAETIRRRTVDAIIIDKEGRVLLQKEGNQTHFVGGGIDPEDENEEAAVRREVLEETGYKNIASIRKVAPVVAGIQFRITKQKNQQATGGFYEVILDNNEHVHSEADEGKHTLEWVNKDEVAGALTWSWHSDGWQCYLEKGSPDTYFGEGVMVNSDGYDFMSSSEAREKIVADLAKKGVAKEKVQYKMRDWLISRQRYWGAPIPIIYCEKDGPVAVPEKDLPVVLPEVKSFEPTGEGSVLATATDWVNTTCPKCGGPATRETDTMDGYACSSWYFLRYADPNNSERAWDPAKANYWLPIDYYCGGDHAVSHLLYSRFWMRFFADKGWIEKSRQEPVGKLVYNGYILAHDGNKMSKSKGNTVNPDDLITQGYGADSVRLFEMFIAPYEQNTNWNTNGVPGTFRFLQRFWTITQEFLESNNKDEAENEAVLKVAHKAIKNISHDLDRLSFNTAVASLMEAINSLYKIKAETSFNGSQSWQFALKTITQLLAPFAPHIAEELWQQLGQKDSVHLAKWPEHDEKYLVSDTVKIVVQVNGKVRATIDLPTDSSEEEVLKVAQANERVATIISDNSVKKSIYIPNKLVNFVI